MKILCVSLKRNLHTRPTKNQTNEAGLKNPTSRVLELNPAFRTYAQCLVFFRALALKYNIWAAPKAMCIQKFDVPFFYRVINSGKIVCDEPG